MNRKGALAGYTYAHFCVDFACFFLLFARFVPGVSDPYTATLGILTYNLIAFGLQPFIGIFLDAHVKLPLGPLGCAMIVLALALAPVPWLGLCLCALGNALFHVAGGRDSLTGTPKPLTRSGIFVSSGAVGVSLGTLAGRSAPGLIALPMLLLAAACVLLALILRRGPYPPNAYVPRPGHQMPRGIPFPALMALCMLAIVLRSLVGCTLTLSWKTGALLTLLPGFGAALGKAAGGMLADRFGPRRIGTASLLLSAPLMLVPSPIPALIGIAAFNIAMPITLCSTAHILPRTPGFAFGLTTLALLVGNAPSFFFVWPAALHPYMIALMTVLAAVCIFLSTPYQKEASVHETPVQPPARGAAGHRG